MQLRVSVWVEVNRPFTVAESTELCFPRHLTSQNRCLLSRLLSLYYCSSQRTLRVNLFLAVVVSCDYRFACGFNTSKRISLVVIKTDIQLDLLFLRLLNLVFDLSDLKIDVPVQRSFRLLRLRFSSTTQNTRVLELSL